MPTRSGSPVDGELAILTRLRRPPPSWRAPSVVLVVFGSLFVACGQPIQSPSLHASSSSPTAATSASVPPDASGSVAAVDRALLDVLPDSIDGTEVAFDAETSATVAADTTPDIVGMAVALAIAPGASGADNFAIANVVRVRPGTFGDSWFRDWRDTYDAGACGPAGGVIGHAEAMIDGRTVFVGSCVGGVLTYHTSLDDGAIVVSITSLGERRFGEKIVSNLED
jgi:hypothetical protein